MAEITLYQKDFGKKFGERQIENKFKDSFDANLAVCKEMDGDYSEKPSMSGEAHGNICKMQNGIELLGWRSNNRIDVIENNRGIIFDVDVVSINKYRNSDELSLLWGADWMGKEKGIHGRLNIDKESGLMNIDISEFKNHTDSPFFTVYDRR